MDAGTLWNVYGRHGMRLYGGRPRFTGWANDHAFALLTGEANLDSNICSLHAGATAADAEALLAVVDAAGAPPTVIPTSSSVLSVVEPVLRAAGFVPIGDEVSMWRPPIALAGIPSPFDVRPAADHAAFRAASRVIAEAHGTAEDLVERVFNLDAVAEGDVECWIAWEGDDPASCGWFTSGEGYVGVWELMTSPRHRRRGAGRAVLAAGIGSANAGGRAPHGAILWATPMGRPLYESIGFVPFDVVVPWVRGGTDEELAAIGASTAVRSDG